MSAPVAGILGALLPMLILLTACTSEQPRYTDRFLAFGTLMELTIVGMPTAEAEQIAQRIETDFAEMHNAWHAWDPGPLGRVNRLLSEGKRFSAPPSVLSLIKLSRRLSLQSGGLFDPAIGRLVDLWGFHRDDPAGSHPPPAEAVTELVRQGASMQAIEIDGLNISTANSAVKLDFGAVGKGYGIDLAISRLREMGVENGIVNGGGDLRAFGRREDGNPWRIGIRHPDGERMIGSVEIIGDESVFTSGNYERNYVWKGVRYHHIIDPRTGYPARGTASVTVIHSDAATADAAATALFIAGPDEWYRIAQQMGVHLVMLMDENGDLYMNPAMRARVKLINAADYRIHLSPPFPAVVTSNG